MTALTFADLPDLLAHDATTLESLTDADGLRARVLAHLWAGGPRPFEYLTLMLCRDIYHCPPDVLLRQPLDIVLAHLACLEAEETLGKWRLANGEWDGNVEADGISQPTPLTADQSARRSVPPPGIALRSIPGYPFAIPAGLRHQAAPRAPSPPAVQNGDNVGIQPPPHAPLNVAMLFDADGPPAVPGVGTPGYLPVTAAGFTATTLRGRGLMS